MIFEAEIEFWNDKVLGGQAPALDGSSAAEEYLKNDMPNRKLTKLLI